VESINPAGLGIGFDLYAQVVLVNALGKSAELRKIKYKSKIIIEISKF